MNIYNSRFFKSNKYNNQSTQYNGKRYMSKFEAKVARDLDLELKSGVYTEVVPQFRIKLYAYLPNGEKVNLFSYICDFRVQFPDGSYVLKEAKGAVTEVYRMKRALLTQVWLPDHPNYSFEEIRMSRR